MTINRTLSLICKSSTAIMRIWERPEFYFFNKHHRLIWYFLKVEFAKPFIDQILWSATPKENKPTTKGCFLFFRYLYKQFSEPENRKLVRSFWMDTFAPPRLMLIWTSCVAPFPRKWPLSKAEVVQTGMLTVMGIWTERQLKGNCWVLLTLNFQGARNLIKQRNPKYQGQGRVWVRRFPE